MGSRAGKGSETDLFEQVIEFGNAVMLQHADGRNIQRARNRFRCRNGTFELLAEILWSKAVDIYRNIR